MGTKKYPVENAYAQYLSAHSGSSNAYTGPTSTNYYFEVSARPANDEEPTAENPSALYGALDRFAQFFIEPLFLANTLDRELRAVDSENKKNLQSDQWRLHQLEKSLSNPKHPYCHFSTGNLEVLKTLPESHGINVRDKFIEFYEKHYSANRMKLCVLGRESLDVLQAWVSDLFSAVENKSLKPNRWLDETPFNTDNLGVECFAKPVMDSRELNLLFPFLDEDRLFESQPSRYISHLIGHEGPGSIMAYIKSKGWANGLSAGAYGVCPGSPGLFDCQIRLTEEVCVGTHPSPCSSKSKVMRSPSCAKLQGYQGKADCSLGIEKLQGGCESLLPICHSSARDTTAGMDFRGAEGHGRCRLQIQAEDTSESVH
jgi:insulysin